MNLSKGEQTQEAIARAAYELFIANGYHGTSMREIATRAELAPASIYNHFPNKEAIFMEVLQRFHPYREILAAVEGADGESVDEIVRDGAGKVMEIMRERREVVNLLFIEIVEFNGRHTSEMFQRFFPRALALNAKLKEAEGELRPIADSSRMLAFVGTIFSQWMLAITFDSGGNLIEHPGLFEDAIDIYLNGILQKEAKEN